MKFVVGSYVLHEFIYDYLKHLLKKDITTIFAQ